MTKNEAIKAELKGAMKARFKEVRAKQIKGGGKVDWFDEYAEAAVPAVRRYLLKQELQGTKVEIEFYEEHLMGSALMNRQLRKFILDWRGVLQSRMKMLNGYMEQYKKK